MPTYDDIYMRDGLDDSGQIPYAGRSASESPDIIPAQNQVITAASLIASYGSQPSGTNINTQQNNNIYVRAKNLGASAGSGTISLYYTSSSVLLTPAQWMNNIIKNASGQSAISIVDANGNPSLAANAIGVGSSAFSFIAPPVPQGFHYCLIAQVVTSAHPNPIPSGSFANTAAFIKWVVDNPGTSWRNVNIVPATLPAYQQGANFTNLDAAAEQYMFIVSGCYWPINTSVNIQCTAVGFNFNYTQPFGAPPSTCTPSNQQNVTTIQTVPALFSGAVMITVTPPAGQPVPSNATLQFVFAKYTTSASDSILRKHAVPASSFGVKSSLGTVQVVRLGECFLLLS
jgi:hypothetical protein